MSSLALFTGYRTTSSANNRVSRLWIHDERPTKQALPVSQPARLSQLTALAHPVTNFANFLLFSNSLHSNHLPPLPAFSPAALRLPAVYNVASGGLRESDFAPRKGLPDTSVRFTPG